MLVGLSSSAAQAQAGLEARAASDMCVRGWARSSGLTGHASNGSSLGLRKREGQRKLGTVGARLRLSLKLRDEPANKPTADAL